MLENLWREYLLKSWQEGKSEDLGDTEMVATGLHLWLICSLRSDPGVLQGENGAASLIGEAAG
jgi:hypothetical protein